MINILLDFKIIIAFCLIVTLLFILTLKKQKNNKNFSRFLLITYLNSMIFLGISFYLKIFPNVNYLFMGLWLIFAGITIIISKLMKVYNYKIGTFLTFFIICIIQIGYVSYTPYYLRQHDARSFTNYKNGGHFGYIGYIFYNNKLPVGSPTKYWCFYNPPFFYIISAIFMKIQNHFGIEIDKCLENLQISALFYIAIFNIYFYKILKEMNIKKALNYILCFVRTIAYNDNFIWKFRKWKFVSCFIYNGNILYNKMV